MMNIVDHKNGIATLVLPDLGEEGQVVLKVTNGDGTHLDFDIVLNREQVQAISRWIDYSYHLEDVRQYIQYVEEGFEDTYKEYGPEKLREIESDLVDLYEGEMEQSADWIQMIRNAVETYDWYKKRGD